MLKAVNGAGNVYAVPQIEPVQTNQTNQTNVAMRGASDFERTPDVDTFESKNKHTGRKVLGWTITLAAIASAVLAFIKGKNAGIEKLFPRLGEGYKQLWNVTKELSAKGYTKVKNFLVKTFSKKSG